MRDRFKKKKILSLIKTKALYLVLQAKIAVIGYLLLRVKHLKSLIFITFCSSLLILSSSNIILAQGSQWPWTFEGEKFQITNDSGDDFSPSIASSSGFKSFYFVVWYRKTPSGFDIYGARVTKDGGILDGKEIPICTASNDQMFPAVAWDGDHFFVVWQDHRSGKRWDIYGTRVTLDGHVLNPNGIPIAIGKNSFDQISPKLSFDGENYIIVWRGKRASSLYNIYFKLVSKNGEVLSEKSLPVNSSSKDQASPAITFDGVNYFIVWQDRRDGDFWNIYGARVTPEGEVLDPEGIKIPYSEDSPLDRWRPVLSWNGEYYLVVWMVSYEINQWDLYGKRVGPIGNVIDLIDVKIQEDGVNKTSPAIFWSGEEYLLVWEEKPVGGSTIFGSSIFPDYRLLIGEKNNISPLDETDSSLPALSGIGDNTLVVWEAMGAQGYWQIYGQFLAPEYM